MSSSASAITVTGSRLGTPPMPAARPLRTAPPLRRSASACAAVGGGWRGARAMAKRPASDTQAFAPPAREATTSVQKETFGDMSNLNAVVKPPETVYTLERAKDELASCIASIGGDPRRAATTSENIAKCGVTEHAKNFRDFTAEERANAVNRGPALEEKMRKVRQAHREVQARRAARMNGLQRPEASLRAASEPGSRPQSAKQRPPARPASPTRSSGDASSLASIQPDAAGLLRRPTVSATELMTASALAVAALQKQQAPSTPPSSVAPPPSIVPSLKEIIDAFHKDVVPTAAEAPENAVNAQWQSHLRAGNAIDAFKPPAVAAAASEPETSSRPVSAGPKIKDWGAWHRVAAPEAEQRPAAGFAAQPMDNRAKITSCPPWMLPEEADDSAPSVASEGPGGVVEPPLENRPKTQAKPPSIVPQIKALIEAYEKDNRPGSAASTRSGSSRATSRSRSSTMSSSSGASRHHAKRGSAAPERPHSAGAVRRQASNSRAAHLAALLQMAERGTHLHSPRRMQGQEKMDPKAHAWATADESSSSASSTCSSSSAVRSEGSNRIPRGAAYMPCPFPVSRGILGIAVR